MAKLSDRLDSTDIVSSPQSSRLAGFTDTTLEDASAWTTADGVKRAAIQDNYRAANAI